MWSPFEGAQVGGGGQGGGQVQQAGGAQFGEQALVQLLPDARLVPLGHIAGRSHPSEGA